MIWKTTNYNGEQVWYSEEEYTILEQENQEAKEIIAELEHKTEDVIEACNSLKYENEEYIKIEDVLSILK